MTTGITWALEADTDRDGTYGDDWNQYVSAEVQSVLSFERGVDRNGAQSAGVGAMTLENYGGHFNRRNIANATARRIRVGFPVRLAATHNSLGYTQWTGYAAKVRPSAGSDLTPRVEIEVDTLLSRLANGKAVYVIASDARTTGDALEAIRVAAGLSADDVLFDAGEQALPWHFSAGQTPLDALVAAAKSELGGHLYERADGRIRFEGRRRRRGVSQFDIEARQDGAVALWRFREATGSTVFDLTGNGHSMTLSGSPARGADGLMTPHDPAKATDFDGSNDYGTVADHAELDTGDTFTWEFVIEVDGLAAQQVVLFKGTNGLTVSITTGGEISLDKAGVANIGASTGAGITAGTPAHVVITKTGATIAIYVDGADVTGTMTNQTIENTATDLSIGYYQPGGNLHIDGRLGALALYPTALTASQVSAHYAAFVGRKWGPAFDVNHVYAEALNGDDDLVTQVEVRSTRFLEGQGNEVLFEFSANMFTRPTPTSVFFPAGVPWERTFVLNSPYVSFTEPSTPGNYKFTENQDGSGTDESANVAVSVTDLGGAVRIRILPANDCYGAYFKLTGTALFHYADQAIASVTKTVDAVPFERSVAFDVPFAGDSLATLKYAWNELEVGRYPVDWLHLLHRPVTDAEVVAMLSRELGDLVWYDDTAASPADATTYSKGPYYIAGVRDDVPAELAGESWDAATVLVPAEVFPDLDRTGFDDFNREDASGDLGTSLSGHAWVNDSGMDLDTQQAIPNTNNAQVAHFDLGSGAWHQVVRVSLVGLSGSDVEAGLAYGVIDTSNYYRCYVDRADELLHLEVVVAGTPTTIATVAWDAASNAEIRVILQEGRHRVDLDGYGVLDEEDFTLNTGTGVGIYTAAGVGEVAFVDIYGAGL